VKPLDPRLLEWAGKYERIVTLEDGVASGGFGSAVLDALAPSGLAGKVRVVGLPDAFLPPGNANTILSELGLDADGVAARILADN
jgi:1-deoxy-D-xylulose-5-phosphate synthase